VECQSGFGQRYRFIEPPLDLKLRVGKEPTRESLRRPPKQIAPKIQRLGRVARARAFLGAADTDEWVLGDEQAQALQYEVDVDVELGPYKSSPSGLG
jgi:hypothetical protein